MKTFTRRSQNLKTPHHLRKISFLDQSTIPPVITMKYTSTRDKSISCSFEEALCSGYAPDGGLLVPADMPSISAETLQQWSALPYPSLTYKILRLFISADEIPDVDLEQLCKDSFDGFDNSHQAVPVIKLPGGTTNDTSVYLAELFHGPTFCFKDLGMRGVVNILSYFATKRQKYITLLVATTGDTGPAAVRAVSDCANPLLNLLVHYPAGQISDFQRRQLTTVQSSCVRVVSFEGGGDDMDVPIKRMLLLEDAATITSSLWTGVNSYNIGRPLMQMVHYVWSYLRVAEREGIPLGDNSRPIDFIVPTGAMGNMVGGYMVKQMGIPLGIMTAAVNMNDITHRVITTGAFHRSNDVFRTLSEAINIQVPYNFERILYYITEQNTELVRSWMKQMEQTQKLDLSPVWLERLQKDFLSARVTDEEMCATIRSYQESVGYIVDPHTAVALAAARKVGYLSDDNSMSSRVAVVLATASPCKFEEAVTTAIGSNEWDSYVASDAYPSRASEILGRIEIEPATYVADKSKSLEENQKEWERVARLIVAELEASVTPAQSTK